MSATAALSAAAVADLTTGGPDHVLAFTGRLALVTGVLALAAGLLRLGFLASFISEPVLKGFIIGLALTIIIGQVPKLLGVEKEDGDFFEQLWGVHDRTSATSMADTFVVGAASLAIVLGTAAVRARRSRLAGRRRRSVSSLCSSSTWPTKGVEIVGHIDSGLPSVGLPDALGLVATTSTPWPPPPASCSSASPKASAPPRPTPPASTTRSMPTGSCSASAPPTSAPG